MDYIEMSIYAEQIENFKNHIEDDNLVEITVKKDVVFEWFKENILESFRSDEKNPDITDMGFFEEWLDEYTADATVGLYEYAIKRNALGFKLHARVTREIVVSYDQMERLNNLLTGCTEHYDVDDIREDFTKGINNGYWESGYIPLDWAMTDLERQFNPQIFDEFAYTGSDLNLSA